jgi:hypothetical protein
MEEKEMPVKDEKGMDIKMIIGGRVVDLKNGITTVDLDQHTLYAENVPYITEYEEPIEITLKAEIAKVNISDIPPGKHFYYKGAEWMVLKQQHCTTTAIDTNGKENEGNPYFIGEIFKERTAVTPCIPGCERVNIGDQFYEAADPNKDYSADTEFLGISQKITVTSTVEIEDDGGQTA